MEAPAASSKCEALGPKPQPRDRWGCVVGPATPSMPALLSIPLLPQAQWSLRLHRRSSARRQRQRLHGGCCATLAWRPLKPAPPASGGRDAPDLRAHAEALGVELGQLRAIEGEEVVSAGDMQKGDRIGRGRPWAVAGPFGCLCRAVASRARAHMQTLLLKGALLSAPLRQAAAGLPGAPPCSPRAEHSRGPPSFRIFSSTCLPALADAN